MNERIQELERVVATIQRTIVSLAREPFQVRGYEVRIAWEAGTVTAYVDGEVVSEVGAGFGSALMTGDIIRACGGELDSSVHASLFYRVRIASGR